MPETVYTADEVDALLADLRARLSRLEGEPSCPVDPPEPGPSPAPAPEPEPEPEPGPVIAGPAITMDAGGPPVIGGLMRRTPGRYAAPYQPRRGEWYIHGTTTLIGDQATCSSAAVPAGALVIYRERIDADGLPSVWAESAPLGPFDAVPAPPPPSGDVWTLEQVERAIATSNGLNEGLIEGIGNPAGDTSWKTGATVSMGNDFDLRNQWWSGGWPVPPAGQSGLCRNFNWWFWLHRLMGTAGTAGAIDLIDPDFQLLYRGSSRWTRPPMDRRFDWCSLWSTDGVTDLHISPRREDIPGGQRIFVPGTANVGAPHGTTPLIRGLHPVNIEGVMVSMKGRIAPGSDAGFQILAQVGGDPKPDAGLPWYPGVGVSRGVRLTREYQDIAFINLSSRSGAPASRLLSLDRLRGVRPLV